MRTGSELLGTDRNALVPLAATLVPRPARVCVLVPMHADVPWATLVEYVVASQTRYWGGHANFVVPVVDDLVGSELFWRLVRQFDPDLVVPFGFRWRDVEEFAPDLHAAAVAHHRLSLANSGFTDGRVVDDHIQQLQDGYFWDLREGLPDELVHALIHWVAPFHHELHLRPGVIGSGGPVPHELTDVLSLDLTDLEFTNVQTRTGDLDQLALTSSVGRFTRTLADALLERDVSVVPDAPGTIAEAIHHFWPTDARSYPTALPRAGLLYPAGLDLHAAPVVIVGDDPHDFLLYSGLQKLRPLVFWLPSSRVDDAMYVNGLRGALADAAHQSGADAPIAVATAVSDGPADHAVDELEALGQVVARRDWRDYVPRSNFGPVDARSLKDTPLLRSGGSTHELPTPVPLSVRGEDELSAGWIVEARVDGWSTFRHPRLGAAVLPGGFSSATGQRISARGACYFGLSEFVQYALGLELNLSRRRLQPLTVLEALEVALGAEEWTVRLSDKGAFATQTSQLFGGVEELVTSLRDQPVRKLLDIYLAARKAKVPGLPLAETQRRYLSLDDVRAVVGDVAEATVNRLYDRRVLARGHILKCDQCRATSFYSLTERQVFVCRRCRQEQRATRTSWLGTAEPQFHYELAEVVYQFLDNDGDVPLIAAFDFFVSKLGARDRRPLDLGFEVEIFSPDGDKSEHDIVAVWGSDLWLGEATRKPNFGDRQPARLRRLRAVADLLAARGVLFATTGQFSELTRQHIATSFSTWPRPEVEFVEKLQVRPDPLPG